jgi:[acyl-carrier-protein] S-malonyltransferase
MKAYIFPGQGAQYPGMGKDLFESSKIAAKYFNEADEILGFKISGIMFDGSAEDLRQTSVTQPAIFLHSVILALSKGESVLPKMVAGHSLGEFSALVVNKSISFEDGLKLVSIRANAMQKACENNPGTMAAVLGLENEIVEKVCQKVDGIVVAANYNCPGQLVISGEMKIN